MSGEIYFDDPMLDGNVAIELGRQSSYGLNGLYDLNNWSGLISYPNDLWNLDNMSRRYYVLKHETRGMFKVL